MGNLQVPGGATRELTDASAAARVLILTTFEKDDYRVQAVIFAYGHGLAPQLSS